MNDFLECTCPNCGAAITVVENSDDAVCSHCGTNFKVRESDSVKISRIENRTRQEIEAENARLKLELQKNQNESKHKTIILALCGMGFCFVLLMIFLIIAMMSGEQVF